MSAGSTQWPHVLADLEAKRQALDQMIGIVRMHFLPDGHGEMPASPIAAGSTTARPDGEVLSKKPRRSYKKRTHADVVRAKRGASLKSREDAGVSDRVKARDAAILSQLQEAPKNFADLMASLPSEPGMTIDQKARACSNALTRLRLKKVIENDDEGRWALL